MANVILKLITWLKEKPQPTTYSYEGKKLFLGHNYKRYSGVDKKAVYGPGTSPCGDLGVLDIPKASNILILISGKGLVWSARAKWIPKIRC